MRRADYIMIESNYDLNMLLFGRYPEYLKSRIRNVNGHLDLQSLPKNKLRDKLTQIVYGKIFLLRVFAASQQVGQFSTHKGLICSYGILKYIFLCHLSQDNNTPEIAIDESRKALEALGLKVGEGRNTPDDNASHVQLVALPRFDCSQLYILIFHS